MKRRPITGRFDVAIIPCGGAKHPDSPYGPYRAAQLYKGTPFRKNLEHAQLFAQQVLIMSAKHGLLQLDDRIYSYEAYLPELTPQELGELLVRIHWQSEGLQGKQIISYLPKTYQTAFDAAARPGIWCSRPYAGLNMLALIKRLNQEIQDVKRLAGR